MRIVTLMENTSRDPSLSCEHGLSLYIETGDSKILFDAGQTDLFAKNAQMLGIDLADVDIAVLSHGHYDHGGGLDHFMRLNKKALVYVSSYAFEPHYNGAGKFIGVKPVGLDHSRIRFTEGALEIGEGITLCSGHRRMPIVPADPFGQTVLEDGEFRPDDYRHEQYLLIRENGKTVCFSGCSHGGILNIVCWFQPDVLIGGFHFMKIPVTGAGEKQLHDSAMALLKGKTRYYTGHCTGDAQYEKLKKVMGDRLQKLSSGVEIVI